MYYAELRVSAILPQNPYKTKKMDNKKKPVQRKKKPRKRFIAVDVWQTQFGPVSERAVYDIYSQKFKVEMHNMRKYSFPHCVNALRKLEDPNYEGPFKKK